MISSRCCREDARLLVTRVILLERDKRQHVTLKGAGRWFSELRNFNGEKNDLINRRGKRAIAMRKIDNRPCKIERIVTDLAERKRHDKLVTGRYTRHPAFAVRLSLSLVKVIRTNRPASPESYNPNPNSKPTSPMVYMTCIGCSVSLNQNLLNSTRNDDWGNCFS